MTIEVPISPEAEAHLRKKAEAVGQNVTEYVAHLLDEVSRKPSLDEILVPVREEFRRSGMSDEELSEFLESEKHAMRAEAGGKSA